MPIWGLRVRRGEGLNRLMGVADRVRWFGSGIMIRLLPPTFFVPPCLIRDLFVIANMLGQ